MSAKMYIYRSSKDPSFNGCDIVLPGCSNMHSPNSLLKMDENLATIGIK